VSATWVVCCGPCELAGEPLLRVDEADHMAGVHDALRHRGRPTAVARPCPLPDPYAAIPRWTEVPR
jgi:hypothetical protein